MAPPRVHRSSPLEHPEWYQAPTESISGFNQLDCACIFSRCCRSPRQTAHTQGITRPPSPLQTWGRRWEDSPTTWFSSAGPTAHLNKRPVGINTHSPRKSWQFYFGSVPLLNNMGGHPLSRKHPSGKSVFFAPRKSDLVLMLRTSLFWWLERDARYKWVRKGDVLPSQWRRCFITMWIHIIYIYIQLYT